MNEYGDIISIKDKQVKSPENVIYSTSSTRAEDFRVLLVMDEYTLHASNILKLSFISSVLVYLVSRGNSGQFYFACGTLRIAYGIFLKNPFDSPSQRAIKFTLTCL
jgi:hypothetical protein